MSNDKVAATYHPHRRPSFDEWLHNYQPLSGRRRIMYRLKRIIGGLIGLLFGLAVTLVMGVGGLIVVGVLIVLFVSII